MYNIHGAHWVQGIGVGAERVTNSMLFCDLHDRWQQVEELARPVHMGVFAIASQVTLVCKKGVLSSYQRLLLWYFWCVGFHEQKITSHDVSGMSLHELNVA